MKNITVSLPDETARWVRVWAAEQDKSVSSALADMVEEKRREKANRQAGLSGFFGTGPAVLSDGSAYPARAGLHER